MFGKGSRSRKAGLTFLVCLGIGAAGIATAAITTNSEPWLNGSTAVATHPTASGVVVDAIWPGDCNAVSVTITNPSANKHAVTITGLNNTGFRNESDTSASQNGNATRLDDFLSQADVHDALNGKVIGSGDTKTFTVPNAVCLSAQSDDARQGDTFQAGYAVTYQVNPGTQAP